MGELIRVLATPALAEMAVLRSVSEGFLFHFSYYNLLLSFLFCGHEIIFSFSFSFSSLTHSLSLSLSLSL